MSTVSLGPTMPMLTVELTRNRPWRSRKGVALRSQSGTTMQWPAAPQLVFSNGTTVGFALSSDSLLAVPATALSAAQVDEIIDSGSAIISLIDPGSGVPWAHGRYAVHYGAGTGGTGNISTSGESVVIIADRIEVIGGGGGGGLTQAQAEEVARDAVGAALVAGAGIGIAVDDAADTITITSTAGSDATTTTKGVVQLAGDLAGTAAAPTVPGLSGKANTSHTHAAGDTTSGTFAIARIPTGTTSTTVALGNHTHSGYAASTHGHTELDSGTTEAGKLLAATGNGSTEWIDAPTGGGGADASLAGNFWARPLGLVSGFSSAITIGANVQNSMGGTLLLDYDIGDPGSITKVALSVWTAHDAPGGALEMYAYYKTSALSYQKIGLIGQADCSTTGTKIVTLGSPLAVPGKFTIACLCAGLTGTVNPAFAGNVRLMAPALPGHGMAGNNTGRNAQPSVSGGGFPETLTAGSVKSDDRGIVIALEVNHP